MFLNKWMCCPSSVAPGSGGLNGHLENETNLRTEIVTVKDKTPKSEYVSCSHEAETTEKPPADSRAGKKWNHRDTSWITTCLRWSDNLKDVCLTTFVTTNTCTDVTVNFWRWVQTCIPFVTDCLCNIACITRQSAILWAGSYLPALLLLLFKLELLNHRVCSCNKLAVMSVGELLYVNKRLAEMW